MAFLPFCYPIWLLCRILRLSSRHLHLIICLTSPPVYLKGTSNSASLQTGPGSLPVFSILVKNNHNTSSCVSAMSQIYPWNLLLPHSSYCFYHKDLLIFCSSTAVHLQWHYLSPGRLQALINLCLFIYSASYNLLSHLIQSDLWKIQVYYHVNSLHYLHLFQDEDHSY